MFLEISLSSNLEGGVDIMPGLNNICNKIYICDNLLVANQWIPIFLEQRYNWADLNHFTNRLFVTYAVFPPPEQQQEQSLGSPAALCGAVWPGWELEDTYLMWGSADCIVSKGPGSAVLGNFRDSICFKKIEMAYSPHSESLRSVRLCLWSEAKRKMRGK